MKDETYLYVSDVKEKAITARSARHRRTHTGKGGRARLPHEYLSKKELEKMSGECVSYRLNEPMTWAEFMKMPDDIKVTYINLLRKKWDVPISHIGKMMGVGQTTIQRETARLGMVLGKGANKARWDKDGFYNWVNGVRGEAAEEPVETPVEEPVEIPVDEECPFENPLEEEEVDNRILLPSPYLHDPTAKYRCNTQTAVPDAGSMTFRCPANMALETLQKLLENEMVEIHVNWRVINGEDR